MNATTLAAAADAPGAVRLIDLPNLPDAVLLAFERRGIYTPREAVFYADQQSPLRMVGRLRRLADVIRDVTFFRFDDEEALVIAAEIVAKLPARKGGAA